MKKAEMMKRLKELQEFLEKDAEEIAEQYNASHEHLSYKMKTSDAYPYMVGWAEAEIKYILTH